MKRTHLYICLFLLSAAVGTASAAKPSGQDILRKALDISSAIKDYTADVAVTVDMPQVKVPQRSARVYFKRPDKVAIDSQGIVMIPRKALVPGNLGPDIMKGSQVTLAGTTTQNGVPLYFLKVAQVGDMRSSDRLLFWVRGDRWTVERMEAQSAGKQQLAVTWEYQRIGGKYWMPKRLVATLAAASGAWHHHGPSQAAPKPPNKPGTVTVVFNNVQVNSGLKDSLFVEKNK